MRYEREQHPHGDERIGTIVLFIGNSSFRTYDKMTQHLFLDGLHQSTYLPKKADRLFIRSRIECVNRLFQKTFVE
jgi:hypothetical protein